MDIIQVLTDFSNDRKASQQKQQALEIKRAAENEKKMKQRINTLTDKILSAGNSSNRVAITLTLRSLIEELDLYKDTRLDDILANEKSSLKRNLAIDSMEHLGLILSLENTLETILGSPIELVDTDSMDTIGATISRVTQALESK